MGFEGRIAVITGAGPGLGTTLSRMLADEGAMVVSVARTARDIPGATVVPGDVTSMSSRMGYAGRSDFAAGKAGVHLLTHCLADEIGPAGVRVNCVAPGWIASSALDDWMAERAADEGVTFEEIRARDVEAMALRRIATEEDVARAVMFLASDASQAITGATLDVNGGQLFT